ncbi:MAG: single-stranded-DNA-specific exonuclease RecJ [Flavobacteriales bacterium]|jgi:single-stranded-DNA-specific exonuclease|nr:MAG: single-stranded-DNA-specific exonuclease RecJ [Flavobacteriales bacterium]
MKWIINKNSETKVIDSLARELNISTVLSSMLVKRGVTTFEQAKDFFRPNFEKLHDPFLMKDMTKATSRIKTAIEKKEKIMIFGDYDVDGTCSVALLSMFLQSAAGLSVIEYIPDRVSEGYGISFNAIDLAKSSEIKLIIALDCGIKAFKQVEYAKENNIEFIICDHHSPDDNIPNATAILNPKRNDCSYPYKDLCGCGVGFKLIQAINTSLSLKKDLIYYLDLVSLAIAADIVPLTGENRIMSFLGLQIINSNPKLGLYSLLKLKPKKEYIISDLMFYVAPRINAAGRINHANKALKLIMSTDQQESDQLSNELELLNSKRKLLEKEMTEQAVNQAEQSKNKSSIVVYSSNWNKGVIGIVASRLVDKFYKPTAVFTDSSNGMLSASLRSIKEIDLNIVLESCSHILEQHGGHKYAAGLIIKNENLQLFKEAFESAVENLHKEKVIEQELNIESIINFDQITPKFFRILKQFEPFGTGNRAPVFLTENISLKGKPFELGKDKEHIKLNLTQDKKTVFSSIGFWFTSKFSLLENKSNFSAAYTIEENNWKDRTTIQLNLKDLK